MIELRISDNRKRYVAAHTVDSIEVAGPSSQWHGTRSYVKLTGGEVVHCTDDAEELRKRVESELNPPDKGQ